MPLIPPQPRKKIGTKFEFLSHFNRLLPVGNSHTVMNLVFSYSVLRCSDMENCDWFADLAAFTSNQVKGLNHL